MEALERDAHARAAATDVARSWLLQAPAGSGKTTVLTARFLALLARADAPDEILALTFTRKAAAEMRHRILQALQWARSDPARLPEPLRDLAIAALAHAAERGWQLLENPGRLRIQTLDALNHWLATQLPVTAGTGATLEIRVPPTPLYLRAARRTLQEAEQAGPDVAAACELLFTRVDNGWGRLEQLLAQMLAQRAHWLPRVLGEAPGALAARVEESLRNILGAQLAAAWSAIPEKLLQEGEELLIHAMHTRTGIGLDADDDQQHWLADAPRLGPDLDTLPLWRALAAQVLIKDGSWRRQFNKNNGFVAEDKLMKQRMQEWMKLLELHPGSHPLMRALRDLPDATLGGADRASLEALAVLLRFAVAQLQLVFAEQGAVDYSYVAGAARAALSEGGMPTELALRFGGALRHVLVDEFQDTSQDQFELLQMLTTGWSDGDGRTLFVVGDPMQSIYQFREAEVGLFLRARRRGVGELHLEALELQRNFRCSPAIVDWVNSIFAGLFPRSEDERRGAIVYWPSISAAAAAAGGVQLHAFVGDERRAEAQRVVEIVQRARAGSADCSVAVLVASRGHAAPIAQALRAAGIAVRGIDIDPLDERPVVRDLSALARVLQHPGDLAAWLAVLGAPWCGLTLAQIEVLFGAADGDVIAQLKRLTDAGNGSGTSGADGRADAEVLRLVRVWQALRPALEGGERGWPLWRRVEHSWLRLGGPAVLADDSELDDADDYLVALAADPELEQAAGQRLEAVAEGLYARGSAVPGAVEMLTIHGAKGLEWDVVILPGMGRRSRSDTEPLLHWLDLPRSTEGSDLLLAPLRLVDGVRMEGGLGDFIRTLKLDRQQFERLRLMYVAATRARAELHLLGHVDADVEPQSGSALHLMWPALEAQFLAALPSAVASPGAAARALPGIEPRLRRLTANWSQPQVTDVIGATLDSASVERLANLQYDWVGATARAVGTIVHAELQRLSAQKPLVAPAAVTQGAPDYLHWLAALGIAAEERTDAAVRIRRALQDALGDERGRWLLDCAVHREAHSEVRVSGVVGGRIVHAIFDRMFIDAHGNRWVVDYKTSTHEGGGLDEFLEREVARYTPQMARYAALAGAIGSEPVRTALYFPLLGVLRELR